MKNIKVVYILIFIGLAGVWTGCDDYLEIAPNDKVTVDNFFQSESDFQAATAPLYNIVWADFNEKFYFGLGDGRGGNLFAPYTSFIAPYYDLIETGLTEALDAGWASFYIIVKQSNNVIIGIEGSDIDEEIKAKYIAEARFMRGLAYWYLATLWGDVVIYEDPRVLVDNPVINKHSFEDAYEFAMRDLEYAAKYLPENEYQPGRVTAYTACGMLSRVYLTYAGYSSNPNSGTRNQEYLDLAKKAAEKVIEEGPYQLMEEYYDLFMIENNNNTESMFALQWVPNGDWGVKNPHQAFFAYGSAITGDDAAWGYWTRASYDVLLEYESTDIRRHATWMGYGDHYDDINRANGGLTFEESDEYLNVKKGVVGSPKDNPKISKQNSALNTYMLRLAEVYLNYAEAVLGNNESTTDAKALEYINLLRKRAGVPLLESLNWEAIRHERRIELCMEGQYWNDLVRRSYYNQQEVVNTIIGQNRNWVTPFTYDTKENKLSNIVDRDPTSRSIGIIDESIFLLPYPEAELVQNPLLKEEPVPYVFNDERITDLFE